MVKKARPKPALTPQQEAERKQFANRLKPVKQPFAHTGVIVPETGQTADTQASIVQQQAPFPIANPRSNAARKAWETRRAKHTISISNPAKAPPELIAVAPAIMPAIALGKGTLEGLKVRFAKRAAYRVPSKPVGIRALVVECYPHIQAALIDGAHPKEIAEDMTAEFGLEVRYGTLRNYLREIAKGQATA